MDGGFEAVARENAPNEECGDVRADAVHLIPIQARSVRQWSVEPEREKNAGGSKTRTRAKVEELPDAAREAIDRMLANGGCSYQKIADALSAAGYTIAKGALGRREAGKAADERMEKLLDRQLEALNRWVEKQSGFDAAGAALALVIGKLGRRIGDGEGLFDKMPAEKAAAGLIQAARAAIQYEKIADDRKKLRAQARAEAIRELREALKREPELWERIEALAAEE
jgi:DNA-binding CsgD family transcriptional regulator